MSVREAIFAEVEARARALPGVAEVERMPSGDPLAYPALEIADGGQQLAEQEAGVTRWRLTLTLAGYVAGGDGPQAHADINALHGRAVAVMFTEPPLGGLAETIEEGDCRFEVARLSDARRMAFAQEIIITFATARGNPAIPA